MAIHELDAEQIRTWSLEQKDRWWLENVYRGDMPQLTLRSALTGMGLSAVLTKNQEPICAGLIAGGALMGIAVAVAELFLK